MVATGASTMKKAWGAEGPAPYWRALVSCISPSRVSASYEAVEALLVLQEHVLDMGVRGAPKRGARASVDSSCSDQSPRARARAPPRGFAVASAEEPPQPGQRRMPCGVAHATFGRIQWHLPVPSQYAAGAAQR